VTQAARHLCCVKHTTAGVTEESLLGDAASHQVIAVCKSADLLLMVLDATKPWYHKEILTRELESVGMRLNR
jgi:ribosome-interacting GTPase 1